MECEEIFFNEPLVVPDDKHSKMEQRFYALGRTNQDRLLFVVYTIRSNKIRVISARDMNKRERGCYQ
ncbi:MAG: BrnT family toxin [Candidatus Margulisbacteria bacterium]|nr:BrnT family toxin [Candidatus Margulisiibacteriota bacterium]